MTGQPQLEDVELVEGEYVVARGTRRISWRVRLDGVWTASRRVPGCRLEPRDAGPGTIWETALTLTLPRGTELERVERRPRALVSGRDLFDFVGREVRSAERTETRTRFRLAARGRLHRSSSR